MHLNSFYPVICTDWVAETAAFYTHYFGFESVFEADWYVSLKRAGEPVYELGILEAAHASLPEGKRSAVAGLILNFEVEDVDAEYRRLVEEAGLSVVYPLTSEEFGQRHFMLSDPSGILIDVITMIPFSGEFAGFEVEQH